MVCGSQTFPKAIAIVLCIVVANYILPILAFSGLDNDWDSYDNGCSPPTAFVVKYSTGETACLGCSTLLDPQPAVERIRHT